MLLYAQVNLLIMFFSAIFMTRQFKQPKGFIIILQIISLRYYATAKVQTKVYSSQQRTAEMHEAKEWDSEDIDAFIRKLSSEQGSQKSQQTLNSIRKVLICNMRNIISSTYDYI